MRRLSTKVDAANDAIVVDPFSQDYRENLVAIGAVE
jgi:hypothetical protein